MWRPFLLWTTLALTILSSVAHGSPLVRNTSPALIPINIANVTLKAPEELETLTYSPWPQRPFTVHLSGPGLLFIDAYLFIISAKLFESSPMVNPTEVRHFIQDFANNIQREHPVPSFAPRHATQIDIDVFSYTKWSINLHEGPLHGRLPTAVALAALDELGRQIGQHGPSDTIYAIRKLQGMTPWAHGSLEFLHLEGVILNKSSSKDNGSFQTT